MHRSRLIRALGALAAALAVAAFPAFEIAPASASPNVSTWTGNTSNLWSVGTNWQSGLIPAAGDQLVFPAGGDTTTTNDLSPATVYDSIALPNTAYTIGGNNITLANGITSVGTNSISAPITLAGDQSFSEANTFLTLNGPVNVNGHTLTLSIPGLESIELLGGLQGTGSVVAAAGASSSTVDLGGSSSFTGTLTMPYGDLFLESGSAPTTNVVLSGGELLGHGTVGSITATDAGSRIILGSPTGTVQAAGDLNLLPGSPLFEELGALACAGPSSNSTLEVGGTVHIAGAKLEVDGGGASQPGQVCMLIDNEGSSPVDGIFANLPEGALLSTGGGDIFQISYVGGDGNDVTLTAVGGPAFAGAGTLRFTQPAYEINQGGGSIDIQVLRVGGGTGSVGYSFQTVDGSAVGGTYPSGDFSPIDFVGGFISGGTNHFFDVFVNDTTPFFGDRTFSVVLGDQSGGVTLGSPATATVTIHGAASSPPTTSTTTATPTTTAPTTTTAAPTTTSIAVSTSTSTSIGVPSTTTPSAAVDPVSGTLPRTGSSSGSVALVGLATLVLGALLAVIKRPRRSYG